MNSRSLARVFIAATLLYGVSGCASLSKSECMNASWEDIGIRDGANGRPEEYLIQHSTACAKVHVVPDRGAYLHGREQGLTRFCVPNRAYQIGEGGGGFDVGICRNFDQERLQDAYDKGREVNRLGNEIGSIDSEMRDINIRLEDMDKEHPLEKKERDALMFRLGVLTVERVNTQRDYDSARYRAREL
jgi:hypothetical protein